MREPSIRSDGVQILTLDEQCPALDIVEQGGTAVALVWPGTGATQRSMHHIALDAGGRTQALQHQGEAVYYVKSGAGTVRDPADGTAKRPHRGLHDPYRARHRIPIPGWKSTG